MIRPSLWLLLLCTIYLAPHLPRWFANLLGVIFGGTGIYFALTGK